MSRTDKCCLLAAALLWFGAGAAVWAMDEAACRVAEADKTSTQIVAAEVPTIDCTPLVEAVEAMRADRYDETIPLDRACQKAFWTACEDNGVPVCLALGLIEVESGFQPDAISSEGCYGLCQLNKKYWPEGLTPEGNILCGISYLGSLLEKYGGNVAAALTAYNAGYDTGGRTYANAVLAAAERWEESR